MSWQFAVMRSTKDLACAGKARSRNAMSELARRRNPVRADCGLSEGTCGEVDAFAAFGCRRSRPAGLQPVSFRSRLRLSFWYVLHAERAARISAFRRVENHAGVRAQPTRMRRIKRYTKKEKMSRTRSLSEKARMVAAVGFVVNCRYNGPSEEQMASQRQASAARIQHNDERSLEPTPCFGVGIFLLSIPTPSGVSPDGETQMSRWKAFPPVLLVTSVELARSFSFMVRILHWPPHLAYCRDFQASRRFFVQPRCQAPIAHAFRPDASWREGVAEVGGFGDMSCTMKNSRAHPSGCLPYRH